MEYMVGSLGQVPKMIMKKPDQRNSEKKILGHFAISKLKGTVLDG